jgi:hypothetical protein
VNGLKKGGALAGVGAGLLCLTRPLTAIGLLIPFAVASLWHSYCQYYKTPNLNSLRKESLNLLSIAAPLVIFFGIFLIFNQLTTGHPLVTGYELFGGTAHHPGFGSAPGGKEHTIAKALGNTAEQFIMLNRHAFSWPIPSMFFIVLLIGYRKLKNWDYLFLSSFVSLLMAYATFWYYENIYGPRYMYEAIGLLALLTARGIVEIFDFADLTCIRITGKKILLLSVIVSWGILSFRADMLRRLYHWHKSADPILAARAQNVNEGIIAFGPQVAFAAALALNEPDLHNDPLWIVWAPPERLILERFPNRKAYVVEHDESSMVIRKITN